MQNGKSYETVLVGIAQAKNWPLFGLLNELKSEDRIPHLEKAFLEAAMQRDDGAALQFFNWLMWSVRDLELAPLLKPAGRYLGHFEMPYSAECATAEENATRPCAAKACELYPKLPTHQTVKARWAMSEEEYLHNEDKSPTLLATRDAMLREISTRCFKTCNDAESSTLLSFLLTVKLNGDGEKKKYLEALESATNKSISLERIARHFEKVMYEVWRKRTFSGFTPDVEREESVAEVLAKGWVRNLIVRRWKVSKEDSGYREREGLKHLLSCMKALAPLMHASDGAIEFLRQFSETVVAPTDALTDGLIQIMREERGNSIPLQKVRGNITVGYGETINHLIVTIDISGCNIFGDAGKQELFVLAKMRTQEWEWYHRFKIHLKVFSYDKYASWEKRENGEDVVWSHADNI